MFYALVMGFAVPLKKHDYEVCSLSYGGDFMNFFGKVKNHFQSQNVFINVFTKKYTALGEQIVAELQDELSDA